MIIIIMFQDVVDSILQLGADAAMLDAGGQACLRLVCFVVAWGIMVQRDRRVPHNAMPATAFELIFNHQDIIPKSSVCHISLCKTKRSGLKDTYPDHILETVLKAVIEKTNTHSNLKILLSDQPLDQALKEKVSASWLLCMMSFMELPVIHIMFALVSAGLRKPWVGLLNVDGHYDSLLALFDNGAKKGSIKPSARDNVLSASNAIDLLTKME
nr:cytokinin riboside 5'-monophosphate phosphoribohydrolase LOG8 [Tanacetum cinerariifolium]